jgi:hypothetical protein
MKDDDYKVKGSSIRSKFDFVKERFGAPAEARLREKFKERPELSLLLDTGWYPFSVYEDLNRSIADEFFAGDLTKLQDVGSFSANLALRTTYKAFARGKDFVQFLHGTGTYYQTFYNKGDVRVTVSDDRRAADLHFSGAPVYTEADLQVAVGFFLEAGRLLGITSIAGNARRGTDGAHVNLRW